MAADQPTKDEKTEPASDKKKSESREKGMVSKSADLNSAVILLFGFFSVYLFGSMTIGKMSSMFKYIFSDALRMEVTVNSATHLLYLVGSFLAISLLPILGSIALLGIISNLMQVGVMFSPKALEFKWSKFNPMNGLKRIFFSVNSLVEIGKGILKSTIVGIVAYNVINNMIADSIVLVDSDVSNIGGFMVEAVAKVMTKVGIAFFIIAAFDYMYQKYEYEKNLRMTKQETKEEYKMSEGDPVMKGRIRTIQKQIAYKRMMVDVPTADVVVTNPTHFAVALKYNNSKMSAPKVVAKGADLIALKIKEIAKEHGVPIVEDKPLAQTLFKNVDIGEQIPEKLFQAVAQILAYIYKLKRLKVSSL
jgi:flagellar biosynthesis protein FlhB